MAYIANTAFEARITNNDRDNLSHIAGLYQVEGANADCSAGLLCVRDTLCPNEGFDNLSDNGVYNENTWYMVAAGADDNDDTVIYACDTYDNQLITAPNGNSYFVGTETLGLGVPAGRYGNFTRINFDNQSVYRFGIGNFASAVGENNYFTIENGLLVPADTPPATGIPYFYLRNTGVFVAGNSAAFDYIDVVACITSYDK